MLYPSPPRLVASVIDVIALLATPAHSLQLLAYMNFAVTEMQHLQEVLTSYHVLSHKAIS